MPQATKISTNATNEIATCAEIWNLVKDGKAILAECNKLAAGFTNLLSSR